MKRKTPVKKLLEAPEVMDLVIAASWLLDRAEIYLDTVGNESNASAVDDVRRALDPFNRNLPARHPEP